MKQRSVKIPVIISVTVLVICTVLRSALTLDEGIRYTDFAMWPARAVEHLALSLLVYCFFAFFIGRKLDEPTFPGKLLEVPFTRIFYALGTILASADAVKDAMRYPEDVKASLAVPGAVFLWLGVGSLLSLSEVEGEARLMRTVRSVLSLTVSALSFAAYVLWWL